MGFVPGLRNDVFISYSHADNERGWVTAFHDVLAAELGQTLPVPPVIERDQDRNNNEGIRAGDDIPSKLKDELYNSAILICIVSPRYLSSEYCAKERDWFSERARQRGDVSRSGRIIKIIKRSDQENLYRELMPDSKECDFRDPASPDGRLEWACDAAQFKSKVAALAIDIEAQLRGMKAKLPGAYVAPCRHEKEMKLRDQLETQLLRDQFNVFPDVAITGDFTEDAIERFLARPECVLSVHMFGGDYDSEAVRHSTVAQRLGKPACAWADVDPKDSDRGQQDLSAKRFGFADYKNLLTYRDHQTANPAEFVQEVTDHASRLTNAKTKRSGAHLYLICDLAASLERAAADTLSAEIKAVNASLEVLTPPDADPAVHYERLKASRAVILYRGGTPPEWFTGHYLDICRVLRKQPALRSRVFLREGAVIPPVTPAVPDDQLLQTPDDVRRFVKDL